MKNEEGTYKQGKFLSNKFKPKGLRVDPVRGGGAQGTKGGPGEGGGAQGTRGFIFLSFLDASFGNLDVNSRAVKCDVGTSHEFRARRDHRWMLFIYLLYLLCR